MRELPYRLLGNHCSCRRTNVSERESKLFGVSVRMFIVVWKGQFILSRNELYTSSYNAPIHTLHPTLPHPTLISRTPLTRKLRGTYLKVFLFSLKNVFLHIVSTLFFCLFPLPLSSNWWHVFCLRQKRTVRRNLSQLLKPLRQSSRASVDSEEGNTTTARHFQATGSQWRKAVIACSALVR